MDLGLSGKTALVAAGSSGLGLAVAEGLLAEGVNVSICGRDPQRLDRAVRRLTQASGPDGGGTRADGPHGQPHAAARGRGQAHGHVVDVRDRAAVKRWVDEVAERHGSVHILVANSGGPPAGGATDFDVDDYRDAVELNLLSSVTLTQCALPHLKAAGWGRVLFVTSVSVRQPIPSLALSNTARAGVVGYAKSLVAALGPGEITVNVLAPGQTRTPRVTEVYGEDTSRLGGDIPLGRIAEPDEFAAVAVFLASARASFVTGAVVPVDGGASRSLL